MNTPTKNPTVSVSIEELDFIRKNKPKSFPSTIAEALEAEGYPIDRVKVHQELTTLKDEYDARIIATARRLLKEIKQVEFQNN